MGNIKLVASRPPLDPEKAELLRRIGAVPVDPHADDDKLDLDRLLQIRAGSLTEAIAIARDSWEQQVYFTITDEACAPELLPGDFVYADPTIVVESGHIVAIVADGRLTTRRVTGDEGVDDGTPILGTITSRRRSLR